MHQATNCKAQQNIVLSTQTLQKLNGMMHYPISPECGGKGIVDGLTEGNGKLSINQRQRFRLSVFRPQMIKADQCIKERRYDIVQHNLLHNECNCCTFRSICTALIDCNILVGKLESTRLVQEGRLHIRTSSYNPSRDQLGTYRRKKNITIRYQDVFRVTKQCS